MLKLLNKSVEGMKWGEGAESEYDTNDEWCVYDEVYISENNNLLGPKISICDPVNYVFVASNDIIIAEKRST